MRKVRATGPRAVLCLRSLGNGETKGCADQLQGWPVCGGRGLFVGDPTRSSPAVRREKPRSDSFSDRGCKVVGVMTCCFILASVGENGENPQWDSTAAGEAPAASFLEPMASLKADPSG